jgi:hypothetical protein
MFSAALGLKIAWQIDMGFWDLGDHFPDDAPRRHPELAPALQIIRAGYVEEARPDTPADVSTRGEEQRPKPSPLRLVFPAKKHSKK